MQEWSWWRALAIALMCISGAASADGETRLLTHLRVADVASLKAGANSFNSEGFRTDASGAPLWVANYFLGALQDESRLGGLGLSALPDGVPVNLANATLTFNSTNMSTPAVEAGTGLTVQVAGTPIVIDEATLRTMLGETAADTALARPSALRQLVQIRQYAVPTDTDTRMILEVLRLENMQPLALEIVVGQGPIPNELLAFEQAMNGNWLVRNKTPAAIIGLLAVGGWLLLRRLRR